jgi:hypothetical protein
MKELLLLLMMMMFCSVSEGFNEYEHLIELCRAFSITAKIGAFVFSVSKRLNQSPLIIIIALSRGVRCSGMSPTPFLLRFSCDI